MNKRSHRAGEQRTARRRQAEPAPAESVNSSGLAAIALAIGSAAWFAWFLAASPVHLAVLSRLQGPAGIVAEWLGTAGTPLGFFDRWPPLAVAALILLAAGGAGRAALDGCRLAGGVTSLERWALALACGLNGLSLATFLLGLAGWLQQWWLLAVIVAVLACIGVWKIAIDVRTHQPQLLGQSAIRNPQFAIGLAIAVCGLVLVFGSLLPPWDFDVREYHLQVPKEWLSQGRIDFLPHNVYGNMPLGAEMQPLLAMALWPGSDGWFYGALAGKLVMAGYTGITAMGLWAAGQRLGFNGRENARTGPETHPTWHAGSIAAVVYLALPWVVHVSIGGLNDGALAANVFLAAYATWLARDGKCSFLVPGFLAGAAAACKYPGLVFAVVPLAIWVLVPKGHVFSASAASEDGSPIPEAVSLRLRALTLVLIGALAGGGAWYAKNWVLAGNPVYPLAYDIFGGRTRTPEKNAQWQRAHRVPRDQQGRAYTLSQLGSSLRRVALTDELGSPLIVPLAGVVLFGLIVAAANPQSPIRPQWSGLLPLAALLYILAIWWLFSHRLDRFLLPAWPFAALLAGLGATWFDDRLGRWTTATLLFVGIAYCLLADTSPLPGDNRYFVSLQQLRRDGPWPAGTIFRVKPAHQWLNQHIEPGQAVLLVGDAQAFDLEMPVFYSTCFDDCLLCDWMLGASAAERAAALESRRVAYVYVDWSEIRRYQSPGNYGFDPRFKPELLDELVRQGILGPPIPMIPEGQSLPPGGPRPPEIFPVKTLVSEPAAAAR